MRKIYLLSIILWGTLVGMAQPPQALNYQAIARGNNGVPLASRTISVRASVLNGSATGPIVYSETHIATTNQFGLFTLNVGTGVPASNQFDYINWAAGAKFLQIETDFNGGANYSLMGTSELVSVPYALCARNVSDPLWARAGNNICNNNIGGNVGIGITNPVAGLQVFDKAVVFSTSPDSIDHNPLSAASETGPGSRFLWEPRKVALRIGYTSNNSWDSLYNETMVIGSSNIVSAPYSYVFGSDNQLLGGYNSFCIGRKNRMGKSVGAYCLGDNNNVADNFGNNDGSVCIGSYNVARSWYSYLFGRELISLNMDEIVLGRGNDTSGFDGSHERAFTVGIGQAALRENAMVIQRNGRIGIGISRVDDKVVISANSALGYATLKLLETEQNDFTRLRMANAGNSNYWDVAGLSGAQGNANNFLNFYFSPSGNVLSLRGDGNAVLMGTLTQNSDERLKKNIIAITSGTLGKLEQLRAYTYQWKDATRDQETQIGFLAQEIEKVFPELVKYGEDGVRSVSYTGMVPVLLQATRELKCKNDELQQRYEADIKMLKAEIELLKKNIIQTINH